MAPPLPDDVLGSELTFAAHPVKEVAVMLVFTLVPELRVSCVIAMQPPVSSLCGASGEQRTAQDADK